MRRSLLLGFVLALCGWAGGAMTAPVRAANTPTKLTTMVPMRDGIHLATDARLPAGDGPWPVVLVRTPYDRRGDNGLPMIPLSNWGQFALNGIVLVVQDTRGRYASEGKARPMVDEGWGEHQDGFDTVGWLRQQPWCNGKIATFGASYLGVDQLLLAGTGAERIEGQVVTVGASSVYHHFFFQNGVFRQGFIEGWLHDTNWPPEALQLIQQHPNYDSLWGTVDLGNRPEQVRWPVVLIGGWYDFFRRGTLDAFTLLQDHGGADAARRPHLVIGPWNHVGAQFSAVSGYDRTAGQLRYPANSSYPPDAPTQLQWLRFWLTGQPAISAAEPVVRYYVMGDVSDPQAPGNVWRTADRWPPPSRPLTLFFTADGRLVPEPSDAVATAEYDYDPHLPVPSVGLDWDSVNGSGSFGSFDQRRVESRPDVLLFTTPPFTQPLEVTGPITVHLSAATSGKDTDFTAKLTDVYPDGRSMLVTDGIIRASYRNSLEKADLLTPGQPYDFDIDVGSTSLIFNRGHRLRVAISSSNYPRFEANQNNGKSWPADQNYPSVVAHETIFLGGADGSAIILPEGVGVAGQ